MNRAILPAVLLFCVYTGVGFCATLTNPYLLVDVEDETGRLFIATIDGLDQVEGDEQKSLLFFDVPHTSLTYIYVDGDIFTFGGDRGVFIKKPVVVGDYIETRWGNELIQSRQTVQWVERADTGLQDGVLIRYEIENRTERPLNAGLRVLLDTCLGEGQEAHFVLDDGTSVEYEMERGGGDVPSWWESSEGDMPGPCLRCSLRGQLITTPQRLVFANYRSLLLHPFHYQIRRNRRFHSLPFSRNDSAVAIFFDPQVLEPGGKVEYGTILGLCGEGRYVFRADRSVYSERLVLPVEPYPGGADEGVSLEEVENILRELESLRFIRGDVEKIDALIDELNEALEGREKRISEERIQEIRRLLAELGED
jgi:hypothetical protein